MNRKQLSLLIAMPGVLFMMGLDITAPNLILPHLEQSMQVSGNQASWVITLYLLCYLGSIITGGRLGDIYGYRNMLALGIMLFAIASVAISFAGSIWLLLLGRTFQGIAAGLIWPNGTTLVIQSLDKKNIGLGLGIFTGFIGLSLATGPLVAGLLISTLDWRWIFLVNIPLCLFSLSVILIFLRNHEQRKREAVDIIGAITLTIVLMSACLALSEISLIALIVAIVTSILFYWQQKKSANPIIANVLIKNIDFRTGCLQRMFVVMPFYVILFLFGSAFQMRWHLSALHAGIMFLPMMVTIGALSPFGGKLIDKLGLKRAALYTAILYLFGFIVLVNEINSSVLWVALLLVLPGIAFSIGSPMSMAQSLKSLPKHIHGTANGAFYMVSLFSGLLSITLSSLLLKLFHSVIVVLLFCIILTIINIIVQKMLSMQNKNRIFHKPA